VSRRWIFAVVFPLLLGSDHGLRAQTPDAESLLAEGEALLRRGRVDAARERWRAVVDEGPDSAAAPRALLRLAQTESDLEQTLAWVAMIAERHADSPEAEPAAALHGEVLSLLGEHRRAVEVLWDYLSRHPEGEGTGAARDRLITSLIEVGRPQAALAEWDHAARANPSRLADAEAAMQRCDALLALEDWERAGARLLELAARFPNREQASRAQLAAGLCFEAQGKWEEAARLHEALTRQWPDTAEARLAERRLASLSEFHAALDAIDQGQQIGDGVSR
jgi:TolA-binding protein